MSLTCQSLPIFRFVKVDPHNRRPKVENRHQKRHRKAPRCARRPTVTLLVPIFDLRTSITRVYLH